LWFQGDLKGHEKLSRFLSGVDGVLSAKQTDFALRNGEAKTCFDHSIVESGG
jgi:hypothetical protein